MVLTHLLLFGFFDTTTPALSTGPALGVSSLISLTVGADGSLSLTMGSDGDIDLTVGVD
jgi:hypothetical protein